LVQDSFHPGQTTHSGQSQQRRSHLPFNLIWGDTCGSLSGKTILGAPYPDGRYVLRDIGRRNYHGRRDVRVYVAGLHATQHRETDARPYLILATKSRNSQYRPAARFSHAATSILEVGVTRNWDRPPVIIRSSGGTPQGFPVDRPGLISNVE